MTTVNIVLTCILCTMIGFAIGNIWGKETMKRTMSQFLNKLTESLKVAAKSNDKGA